MRVAIIGNMNNNHFALMRYLRDLGIDAYLFLYRDEIPHFMPECDTWELKKWKNYIIQTELTNGNFKVFFNNLISRKKIKKYFDGFDFVIANGFFPVYAYFLNIKIDLFLPYGFGGEFINKGGLSEKWRSYIGYFIRRYLQSKGLKYNTEKVATIDFSFENIRHFKALGCNLIHLGIPMVYPEDVDIDNIASNSNLFKYIEKIKQSELSVFSHVSHIWKNLLPNFPDIKRNNILIEGFAKYIKNGGKKSAKLFLLEYGKNVEDSKQLIASLGIEDFVEWIPKMLRKEIMILLKFVNIGCSELGGVFWGGVGWEFMASGVPFMHYLNMTEDEFRQKLEMAMPKFINVSTPDEICESLFDYEKNPEKYKKMGEDLKTWFNTYNGVALAQKYKDIICSKNH